MKKLHLLMRMLLTMVLTVITLLAGTGMTAYAQGVGGQIDSMNKYAIPGRVSAGGQADVNLSINALPCVPPFSASVALVIDKSQSMSGTPLTAAKAAAALFIDTLDLSRDEASVVAFSGDGTDGNSSNDAQTLSSLSQNRNTLQDAIASVTVDNRTNIYEGLHQGGATLTNAPAEHARAIVLLTDGLANIDSTGMYDQSAGSSAVQDTLDVATDLKSQGIRIYTIGLGSVDESFLRNVANSPAMYYHAPAPSDLPEIYARVARSLLSDIGTDGTLVETYDAAHFAVIAGSQVPASGQIDATAGTITWDFATLSSRQGVSYRVRARDGVSGTYDVSTGTTITYTQATGCSQAGQALDFSFGSGASLRVSDSSSELPPPVEPADVDVTVTADPNLTVGPGDTFTLTVTATNRGFGDARNVDVVLPLHANQVQVLGTTFSRSSVWVSDISADSVTVSTGSLSAGGDTASATLSIKVLTTATVGADIDCQADFTWSDEVSGGSGRTNACRVTVSSGSSSIPFFALDVNPFNGPVGTTHQFSGDFFTPNEPVAFWYDTPAGTSVEVGRETANASGVVTTSLTTTGLPPGTYTMVAHGIWSNITAVGVFRVE
jgi:hypothetical protein